MTKLDAVAALITVLCLLGVAAAAFISDPARQPARVGYLYPAIGGVQNVWVAAADGSGTHSQLSFSEGGVYDFDFSPDGRWLAYAERTAEGGVTLRLLDIPSRRLIDLVDCAALQAHCSTPVFSPDGSRLAYQRSESNGAGYGLARIWLVDMHSPNYPTAPLIADTQVVGHSAVWSQDSRTVAFYSADPLQSGILIFDLLPRGDDDVQLRFIPSAHGSMGTLAPNGRQLVFPEIVRRSGQVFSHLRIADLNEKTFAALSDPMGPTDDVAAQWHPDGAGLALARRYTDDRWTAGHQLYFLPDYSSGEPLPIVHDRRYSTAHFRWDAAGSALVMQRFPLLSEDGSRAQDARPEVWVYDLGSGESRQIATNAFLPRWAA